MTKSNENQSTDLEMKMHTLELVLTTVMKTLIPELEKIYEDKSISRKTRQLFIKSLALSFASAFQSPYTFKTFLDILTELAYKKKVSKIRAYMYSLCLSKDYSSFKKLRPLDIVRYVRFYLGKKGETIPLKLVPLLLKEARRVKANIVSRMHYYMEKEKLFLSEEEAFSRIKRDLSYKKKFKEENIVEKLGNDLSYFVKTHRGKRRFRKEDQPKEEEDFFLGYPVI